MQYLRTWTRPKAMQHQEKTTNYPQVLQEVRQNGFGKWVKYFRQHQ
jgi:hypothetical protein